MTPTQQLDHWLARSKSRAVEIVHDNGYGASAGWEVRLSQGTESVLATGHHCGLWDDLDVTITRALDLARRTWPERSTITAAPDPPGTGTTGTRS